ncbi:MAG: hypothetical protein AAGF77_10160 [Bacteroidota bacterium]
MHRFLWLLIFICLYGCQTAILKEDLPQLNGYWEITLVEFPDGSSKAYSVNTSIDYIALKEDQGYRKKVQPNLDGSFRTSDDAEVFTVHWKEGQCWLHYKNGLNTHEERLIQLSPDAFAMKNAANIVYHYKKYQTINITP